MITPSRYEIAKTLIIYCTGFYEGKIRCPPKGDIK